ncbi:ABC transporter ATP-binding protein [Paenibacillus eucommiae]|uniref:ATP-binding cassette subfamily B protein/subfamily B ATP-binding cassette protein MsbA n=1 Tax=Paenibacillus eucommiae TaxID=1355755 RepID=A0ABS4J5R5_9BACL|nr:ABC transporter ATP-binding protein [Paenibacillus eucommiae]MBP1994451.1 ATP-binding cassette subfamily B protein/subfamily B ATP-binding cassette protein MsbA [Paenibacillus eucommiae]
METQKASVTFRWAIRHLLFFKTKFALIVTGGLLLSGTDLVLPIILQQFTEGLQNGADVGKLLITVVLLLAAALFVRTWLSGRVNMWNTTLSELALKKIHENMFNQLRSLGITYTERVPTGDILSLYHNEVQAIQSLFTRYFRNSVEHGLFLMIGFTYLCTVNWILSIAIIPFFLSYYLIGPYFEKKAAIYSKQYAEQSGIVNAQQYESVASLLEMRQMNADRWDTKKLERKMDVLLDLAGKSLFNAFMRGTVRRLTVAFGSVFIFFLGVTFIRSGDLSVGGFVAFSILYFMVIERLTFFITNLTEQKMISHQITRLYLFMQEEPEVRETSHPVLLNNVRGELHLRGVTYAYPAQPGRPVLSDLSLHINAGETVAIVGPSGSGKSTLIKLLGRLYQPGKGSISLDGVDMTEMSLTQIRESVGYVFQETFLFPGSIRDNIGFGKLGATDEEITAASEAAYASEFIDNLPDGYDTEIGERGYKLSGGQKQRIAIARLFLKNPPVLLLDEATSALDNVSEREVRQALDKLLVGRTTVIIAHRLSTIAHVSRIILVKDGVIAEEGSYEQLLEARGLFYAMATRTSIEGMDSMDGERMNAS